MDFEKKCAVGETPMMAEVDVTGCCSCTEGGTLGFEAHGIGTTAIETQESGTSEIETSGVTSPIITPECTGNTEPCLDGQTEGVDLFGPDVVLDCTRPRLDLVAQKDLATETRSDISGNIAESESRHGETSPFLLRPEADHQIETETGSSVTNGSPQDPTEENSAPDVSAGSCFVPSIPEAVSSSAFANEPQKNAEEVDETARVKFEPGVKCSDVSKAVEILKTSYRLSDVTIRKNMITWSCWNIADVIRGPHKETTWWNGRSLPRKKDTESSELQEVITEELSGDKEFRQEMAELCRKIDTKDRELVLILDDILHVAQQNNYDFNMEQTDPFEVLDNQMIKNQPTASRIQSTSGPVQQTSPVNGENSAEALSKHRNPFAQVMRAIRRRFSRRNQTRK